MRWRLRFHVFPWLLVFLDISIVANNVFSKTLDLVIYIFIVIVVSKVIETVNFVFVDFIILAVVVDFCLVLSCIVFFVIWNGN